VIRFLAALSALAASLVALAGCGPSYSPDTYATNAAQQANKVEAGVIAGVRKVHISAQGAIGGVAGAAAGGVAGSQAGVGPSSAFGAIGGSVLGGLAGTATEHIIGDTDGFEYIVRKINGEMISVAQRDEKPLWVGEKVLVISGPQARIVPDYTVPFGAPTKLAGPRVKPPADAPAPYPPAVEATPALPVQPPSPTQSPAGFGPPSVPLPQAITPAEVLPAPAASASSAPGSAAPKP
jgi:outer membrane lipoprotein SlyB